MHSLIYSSLLLSEECTVSSLMASGISAGISSPFCLINISTDCCDCCLSRSSRLARRFSKNDPTELVEVCLVRPPLVLLPLLLADNSLICRSRRFLQFLVLRYRFHILDISVVADETSSHHNCAFIIHCIGCIDQDPIFDFLGSTIQKCELVVRKNLGGCKAE